MTSLEKFLDSSATASYAGVAARPMYGCKTLIQEAGRQFLLNKPVPAEMYTERSIFIEIFNALMTTEREFLEKYDGDKLYIRTVAGVVMVTHKKPKVGRPKKAKSGE